MDKKNNTASKVNSLISTTPESELIKKEEYENSPEKQRFDPDRFWDGETIYDD